MRTFNWLNCSYFGLLLLGIGMISSCATEKQLLSSAPTGQATKNYHPGKFVWFDLLTDDVAVAEQFYAALFGWRFRIESDRPGSVLILNRGQVIGSILDHLENTVASENAVWLSSLSVTDVDKASKIVKRLGGQVLEEAMQIKGRGRFAVVSDSQGAALVLLHSESGDANKEEVEPGGWLWVELWAQDLKKAAYFYKTLVSYATESSENGASDNYFVFSRDGVKRAGMIKSPWQEFEPTWLPYVRVNNVHEAVIKTQHLGGRVIIAPDPEFDQGHIAIIADPTGGVLAIQELR